MSHTGLLPKWDVIEAISAYRIYNPERNASFIGIEIDEDDKELKATIQRISSLDGPNLNNFDLAKEMRHFYNTKLGISESLLSDSKTGNIRSDAMIQNLVIPPSLLEEYESILVSGASTQGPEFAKRLTYKRAKNILKARSLFDQIQSRVGDQRDRLVCLCDRETSVELFKLFP
jgi:hypothetical protein